MEEKLKEIVVKALKEIDNADKEATLMQIKSKFLGKNSELVEHLKSLKSMPVEERKTVGSVLNQIKIKLEEAVEEKLKKLSCTELMKFDETIPVDETIGSLHPITIITKELTDILKRMGFTIVNGFEMETEYYNFEALNIPGTHPARDMQDTYWLSSGELLRTHTSPNQVRTMEKYGAPIRMAAPGRCFRNEDLNASHENTFFQCDGMVIDKNISISNLIYVMKEMLKEIFKSDVNVRLRPGYFPFVEPGFELDCSCLICGGSGCPTCGGNGWIELCPCGMIHPNVLKMSGINPDEYNGFAFGLGLTRLAMLKYKINDIRVLNSGDIRYLSQFSIE